MKTSAAALAALIVTHSAMAASAGGHDALALAAITGRYSSQLGHCDKTILARLLDGHATAYPRHAPVVVRATAVVCRASDVDITQFSCALTFAAHSVNLTGHAAQAVFATLTEAAVPSDGAAGTIYEAVHALECTIDPAAIAQRAGGGATCSFEPGPA